MKEIKFTHWKEHQAFCLKMHELMNERGLSVADLAKKINVSRQSIYNFETDRSRNPSRFLAGKIATYLGIKAGDWKLRRSE